MFWDTLYRYCAFVTRVERKRKYFHSTWVTHGTSDKRYKKQIERKSLLIPISQCYIIWIGGKLLITTYTYICINQSRYWLSKSFVMLIRKYLTHKYRLSTLKVNLWKQGIWLMSYQWMVISFSQPTELSIISWNLKTWSAWNLSVSLLEPFGLIH